MKAEELLSALGEVDDRLLIEAKKGKRAATLRLPKWLTAAACFVLAAAVGLTAYGVAGEAAEYRTAIAFFEESGLSAEGLTRAEVKEVFRDITENKFENGKTTEVILHSLAGYDVGCELPSEGELATLISRYNADGNANAALLERWYHNHAWNEDSFKQQGIRYEIGEKYVFDPELGFDVWNRGTVRCLREDTLLWTSEISDFMVSRAQMLPTGTAVWGANYTYSSTQPYYGWLACLDDQGGIRWKHRFDNGYKYENVVAVLENDDGSWAVFCINESCTVLYRFGRDGSELSARALDKEAGRVKNAVRLGEGYLMLVGDRGYGDDSERLVMMDQTGTVSTSFSYEEADRRYKITDMIEFGGRICLSAYAYPDRDDEGGRDEIADILDQFCGEALPDDDMDVTEALRKNFRAVLLVCDPSSGSPKTFYTADAAVGSSLSVGENGELSWAVESFVNGVFSPFTSAYSVYATTEVYLYTFDGEGALISRTDTGRNGTFAR